MGIKQAFDQALDEISATQKVALGQVRWEGDRKYIYSQAKEALVQGNILVKANTAAHYGFDAVATNTAAEGSYAISQIISITAADTIVAGEYAGLDVFVDDGTGEGQLARIETNTGGAASATIKLYLTAAMTTALTAVGNSDITILEGDRVFKALVTTQTQRVIGVAPMIVTDEYYFWRQVKGNCVVLMGEAGTILYGLKAGDDTAGTAIVADTEDHVDEVYIFGYLITPAPAADTLGYARINCE